VATESSTPASEPFEQWQVATARLAKAEADNPYSVELERLADAVLDARLALSQARIEDGWTPEDDQLNRLAVDTRLVKQKLGEIEAFLPDGQPEVTTTTGNALTPNATDAGV
jgi:hypothetical protein